MTTVSLIHLLITILVVGLIAWVAIWAVRYLGVPEPLAKVIIVAIVVICCLIVIYALLPMTALSAVIA